MNAACRVVRALLDALAGPVGAPSLAVPGWCATGRCRSTVGPTVIMPEGDVSSRAGSEASQAPSERGVWCTFQFLLTERAVLAAQAQVRANLDSVTMEFPRFRGHLT